MALFLTDMFWPLCSIATSSFVRIYPGCKHFWEAAVGQICFLSAVFVVLHSRYQSTLIPVPTSIRLCEVKGFILTLISLVLSAGFFPSPYTQRGSRVPSEKDDVSWRCFPGRSGLLVIRRVLSPQNSWTSSFMHPYSWEMIFIDKSLDCVVSQRPLCGTLVRLPWTLSLMFPYSRRIMIVLRWPLHSVASHRNVLGIFVPLPPAVLMGFNH